jgi:hypothetical protein
MGMLRAIAPPCWIVRVAYVPHEVEEEHEHLDDNEQPNKISMSTQTTKNESNHILGNLLSLV